ncbi:MAG: YchJ family metal-binding protein, partial [Gammaproteobacteria bacterium]|nr:YchJ family metal-binding protein [Gammaproteobacteria bacterium]
PCGSGKTFIDCCKSLLDQSKNAATAEALMRSRYTAFVLKDAGYLRYSWHPDTCPRDIHLSDCCQWLELRIKKTVAGEMDDINGEVEFVARSKNNGKAHRLHENSRFSRFDGRWVYLDGKFAGI